MHVLAHSKTTIKVAKLTFCKGVYHGRRVSGSPYPADLEVPATNKFSEFDRHGDKKL